MDKIRIIIQHQQNVSKVFQLLILDDDDYLLNDMLVHVIDQQLKMPYLSYEQYMLKAFYPLFPFIIGMGIGMGLGRIP
jgi:hypothetical protein